MGRREHARTLAQSLLAGLLTVAVSGTPVLAGGLAPASAGPASTGSDTSLVRKPADAAPAAASGMLIHIDPRTGTILKDAAPGSVPLALTPDLQNALSTSDQGLVEVQGSAPGRGVKVDLQGRFRNPVLAITDASGKLTIYHLHESAGPGEQPRSAGGEE